jgi:hypothetical protein
MSKRFSCAVLHFCISLESHPWRAKPRGMLGLCGDVFYFPNFQCAICDRRIHSACGRNARRVNDVESPMPNTRARRYSIEIKDANGARLFSTVAYWDDKDQRNALAQITRLAGLPEVNFYAEPALEPTSGKRELVSTRLRSKTPRPAPR